MSLPSREQRILDAIEYRLRVSDPALVSSFGRLAGNTRRGWLQALRRWKYRQLSSWPHARRSHRPFRGTPVVAFIPVFMLAILSVILLAMPGHQQRGCQPGQPGVWSIAQPARCVTSDDAGGTVSRASGYPAGPGSYLPARIRRLTHP